MRLRGSELAVMALEDEGARFAFGIPGTHNIELYDALEKSSVRAVLVTDEQGASFMADGLSRGSDSIGVVNVVPGAGVTHALSGIGEAFLDNVPLVVLCAGIRNDSGRAYQLHDVDQLAVLRPLVKSAVRAETAEEVYPRIREAFALARAGVPGPTAVELPANLLMKSFEVEDPRKAYAKSAPSFPVPHASSEDASSAAELLNAAEFPLIYAGRGAAKAAGQLKALAKKLGAPVATTIQGKGVFPESDPLWLWNGVGRAAPAFARGIQERADAALAIGCRFGEVATGSYGWTPPETLIHADIDPKVLSANYPAKLGIVSDAGAFLERLLPLIKERPENPALLREIAEGHAGVLAARKPSKDRVSPGALFSALQSLAGNDAVFTADSGNGTFLAMEHLRLDAPNRFLAPVDYSCMGYAVPAAIGAKLIAPNRDVIALEGDGALLMTGLELLTAARYEAGVVVILLRDGELAQIAQFQDAALSRKNCTALQSYDAAAFAKTVGCAYLSLPTDERIEPVLTEAFRIARGGEPVLVETLIDYSEKTYFTKGALTTNFLRLSWRERLEAVARVVGRKIGIT